MAIMCPDEGGSNTCGTTDFCGQDAQYPDLHQQDFTCIDADGGDLDSCPTDAVSNEMVRDELTGLLWQRADLPETGMAWQAGSEYCQNLPYANDSEWRLPNAHELMSIMDDSELSPTIDLGVFPNTKLQLYWSNEVLAGAVDAGVVDSAWAVSFTFGFINSQDTAIQYFVRCVNGPNAAAGQNQERFATTAVDGGSLVEDSLTGLVWQGDYSDAMTWQLALAHCESLEYGGFADWRLPKRKTLLTLVDYSVSHPASTFSNMPTGGFWSASTNTIGPTQAWLVDFIYGKNSKKAKSNMENARCVRSPL